MAAVMTREEKLRPKRVTSGRKEQICATAGCTSVRCPPVCSLCSPFQTDFNEMASIFQDSKEGFRLYMQVRQTNGDLETYSGQQAERVQQAQTAAGGKDSKTGKRRWL